MADSPPGHEHTHIHIDDGSPCTGPTVRGGHPERCGRDPSRIINLKARYSHAAERFPPWTVWRPDRRPCRVHITAPPDFHPGSALGGHMAFCGQLASSTEKGPKVTLDPQAPLAPGEAWCPRCLGGAVVHLGGVPTLETMLRTLLAERTP